MIGEYCKGYDVVYGQRKSRAGESSLKRLTAWAFYRFMRKYVHPDLPPDAGDFPRLISKPLPRRAAEINTCVKKCIASCAA